jgi:hypothetical protein
MRQLLIVVVLLSGCSGDLISKVIKTQAIGNEASVGEPKGVIETPEGDVGVIVEPPIPTEELCYIKSRMIKAALVPIRCADLAKLPN